MPDLFFVMKNIYPRPPHRSFFKESSVYQKKVQYNSARPPPPLLIPSYTDLSLFLKSEIWLWFPFISFFRTVITKYDKEVPLYWTLHSNLYSKQLKLMWNHSILVSCSLILSKIATTYIAWANFVIQRMILLYFWQNNHGKQWSVVLFIGIPRQQTIFCDRTIK